MKLSSFSSLASFFLASCSCAESHLELSLGRSLVQSNRLEPDGNQASRRQGAQVSGVDPNFKSNLVPGGDNGLRHVERKLQGDFAEFNELFENALIRMDDEVEFNERVLFNLSLRLRNVRCYEISIGDINVGHRKENPQLITVNVDVTGLDLTCEIDYRYDYGPFHGGGTAYIVTENNAAAIELDFTSTNFDSQPPNGSSPGVCTSVIDIVQLEFEGDFVSDIIELFEGLVSNFIEGKVEEVACDELGSLGTTFVRDMMDIAEDTIEGYLGDLGSEYTDPLYLEQTLEIPSDILLLNFQDTENIVGSWFTTALQEADELLGTELSGKPGLDSNHLDLGVNTFLRDYFLEDDGSFTLEADDLTIDPVLFQGHDRIVETTITLDRVKIFGLDTFTKFEPLIAIGKYTLQNELSWEYLTLEFEITCDMKPSTKDDAILEDPTSEGITEKIKVDFGVDDVEVIASVLLAVDQEALGSLTIGPLLNITNILPCIMSMIHAADLSGLDVTIGNIREPTLSDFVSPGLDRVFTSAVEAAFAMYEGTLLRAIPNMFQTTMRDFVNKDIIDFYMGEPGNSACPEIEEVDGFIDFRDFLLPPDQASISGGSGLAQYGDLAYTVMELARDQLLSADSDGFLSINDVMIRPITESQSGESGTMRFPSELVSFFKNDISNHFVRSFMESFEIGLFDTRIRGLDIFKQPAAILQPKNSPYTLANILTMGPASGRQLNLTIGFLVAIEGEDSPLQMRNEMDVSVSVSSASLNAEVFANVVASKLLDFPLRDVLNYNCWLATFPSPKRDGSEASLALSEFAMSLSEMDMNVNFNSTTSPGVAVIPELTEILKMVGATTKLNHRLMDFAGNLMTSQWVQTQLDRRLVDAAKLCPHSDAYNKDAVPIDYDNARLPELSLNDVDTVLFAIALVAEVAVIVLTESHRLAPQVPTDPMSAQASMNVFSSIVDWTNLEGQVGEFVDMGLKSARNYLGSPSFDKSIGSDDLGVNILMRDFLLGPDGYLTVNFDDLSFELPGFEMSLDALRVGGLDSITNFNMWEPIAPQTLQNTMAWDSMMIEVTLSVRNSTTMATTQEVKISFSVGSVEATAALAVALDQDKLGELQIGNFMNFKDILPCLMSATDALEITQMNVTLGDLNDPKVEGLFADTEGIVSSFTEEAFGVYRSRFIAAFPQIFDGSVRQLLNRMISSYRENVICEEAVEPDDTTFIDFRKFFNPGSDIYGDIPPLLKSLVDNELLAVDTNTGMPRINEVLITPFTEDQSGVKGSLEFPGNMFSFGNLGIPKVGVDTLDFRAFDAVVDNLNTVGAPIKIFEPMPANGFLLDNYGILGTKSNPLRFALTTLLALTGDPALSMYNELHISVELAEADLFATVLARIMTKALFSFPLRDIADADCWLAIFATPQLDEAGLRKSGFEPGLALEYIGLALSSMRFDFSCVNCTSPGLSALPEVLETLEVAGVSDVLEGYLVNLALELLQSETVQAYVDRLLVEGSRQCRHSVDYVDPPVSSDYPSLGIPILSSASLEAIAFATTFGVSVGMVVIAESHLPTYVVETDPFSGQKALEVDDGVRLLDFMSLDSSVGEWADAAVEELRKYLSDSVDDPDGPNGRDLQVNRLLRSTLLDSDRTLSLEFNDLKAGSDDVMVSLSKVRFTGLDTISNFNVADAIGPQTLLNELGWRRLGVELVVSMMGSNTGSTRKQDITVALELADVEVSLAVLLALDLDLLGSLELGSMLEIKNILPCVLSTAHASNLTQFQVSVGAISAFSVDGFLSEGIDEAVSQLSSVILQQYGDTILSSLPGFFDTTVRAMINNWIKFYMDDRSNVACPSISFEMISQSFVDFRDLFLSKDAALAYGGIGDAKYGDLFSTLLGIIQDTLLKVDPVSGLSAVNDAIIGPLTRSQSDATGSLIYPGDLFNQASKVSVGGLNAQVQLKASDARIDNLDTVGSPLRLLQMVFNEPHQINNTATFGISQRPLSFAVRFLIALVGDDGMEINNDLEIGLDLHTANLILRALMKISESKFFSFPLRDILNLDCWLATMPPPELDPRGVRMNGISPSASLEELVASIAELNLNISCVHCSSPRMPELTELLSSSEAKRDATLVANMVLDYVTQLMGGPYLQMQIDRILNDAAKRCPHSPLYDPDWKSADYEPFESGRTETSLGLILVLGLVCLFLVIVVSILVYVIRCIVRRRHRKWLGTLAIKQTRWLVRQQAKEKKVESDLNERTTSMFRSPVIPAYIRWSMPFIILGNIGFFLSGHLSLGATVNIEAELAGEKFRVEQFFEFSMAQSTIDIWNAGGKELAILILIFSGIWPYTKQMITLFLWFVPPQTLSTSRRGSILLWLDCLGKWSMVDIFVLVISIAAFRVSIVSPDVGFLPKDFYFVNLLVVPLWGLYANMIAQVISQVSSHFIIHYHRRIIQKAKQERLQMEDPSIANSDRQEESTASRQPTSVGTEGASVNEPEKDKLCRHKFGRPHRGESEKLVIRNGVDKVVWASAAFLLLLVIFGCSFPSFSLEILGIIGVAVESGQGFEDAITEHSVFTVIKLLFDEAKFLDTAGDYLGLGTLSILLLFSVLFVPGILCLTLLRQWFYPATRKERSRLAVLIEMLQAWQYSEVYLIAVFVASWQLGPISEFMINSYCESLEETFAQLVYYGILRPEDAQCFRVQSSIEGGSFILASGAILLALLSTFVTKAVTQYFRDKDQDEKKLQGDNEEASLNSEYTCDDQDDEVSSSPTRRIHPVPVLFTDTFRWALHQQETFNSRQNSIPVAEMVQDTAMSDLERARDNEGQPLKAASNVEYGLEGQCDDAEFLRASNVRSVEVDEEAEKHMHAQHGAERQGGEYAVWDDKRGEYCCAQSILISEGHEQQKTAANSSVNGGTSEPTNNTEDEYLADGGRESLFDTNKDLVVDNDCFEQEYAMNEFKDSEGIKEEDQRSLKTMDEASNDRDSRDEYTEEIVEDEPSYIEKSFSDSGEYYYDENDGEFSVGSWVQSKDGSAKRDRIA